MPLRCCAMMGRRRGRGRQEEDDDDERRQRAASASAAVVVPRRGRWVDGEQQPPAAAAVGWRCRSCAAAAIADCVALGCCPCAVVALMGLALVRAPLAVGRRFRRRRPALLRRKRVRDVAASSAAGKTTARDKGARATEAAPSGGSGTLSDPAVSATAPAPAPAPVQQQQQQMQQAEAEELAWVDEMYRVGHWGFGRVSFSGSGSGSGSASAGKTP